MSHESALASGHRSLPPTRRSTTSQDEKNQPRKTVHRRLKRRHPPPLLTVLDLSLALQKLPFLFRVSTSGCQISHWSRLRARSQSRSYCQGRKWEETAGKSTSIRVWSSPKNQSSWWSDYSRKLSSSPCRGVTHTARRKVQHRGHDRDWRSASNVKNESQWNDNQNRQNELLTPIRTHREAFAVRMSSSIAYPCELPGGWINKVERVARPRPTQTSKVPNDTRGTSIIDWPVILATAHVTERVYAVEVPTRRAVCLQVSAEMVVTTSPTKPILRRSR